MLCAFVERESKRKLMFIKLRSNDSNISTQHIATLLGATCCAHLATLLRRVVTYGGCCLLKFENSLIFHATFVDVAWCCSHLARFVQQCCACAWRLRTSSMSQHVATWWPNAYNMLLSTMLWSIAFKCCDCLTGACKCWASNVGICCVEMLWSFGWGLRCLHRVLRARAPSTHRWCEL